MDAPARKNSKTSSVEEIPPIPIIGIVRELNNLCTLASAIACSLAKGRTTIEASISGQQFVHAAVLHSIDLNLSQNFPNRFYKQRS